MAFVLFSPCPPQRCFSPAATARENPFSTRSGRASRGLSRSRSPRRFQTTAVTPTVTINAMVSRVQTTIEERARRRNHHRARRQRLRRDAGDSASPILRPIVQQCGPHRDGRSIRVYLDRRYRTGGARSSTSRSSSWMAPPSATMRRPNRRGRIEPLARRSEARRGGTPGRRQSEPPGRSRWRRRGARPPSGPFGPCSRTIEDHAQDRHRRPGDRGSGALYGAAGLRSRGQGDSALLLP